MTSRGTIGLQVHLDLKLARALHRYAADQDRTRSGITRQALRRTIPQRYFEDEDEAAEPQPDTAA